MNSMELNFNWKYKDYELRACPKRLVKFSEYEQNETIDFIKWQTSKKDGERYCFSLAYWKRGKDGFDLRLVKTRAFDEIDEEDLAIIWKQLHIAQLVLDKFWELDG